MKPLSIHFVTRGRSNRGGHVVVTHLMRELLRRGHDVSLTSWHEDGKPLYPDCEDLWRGLDIEIIDLPFGESENRRFAIEQAAMAEHLRDVHERYDVILLDGWPVMMAAVSVGAHRHENVIQLVQSDPRFAPEDDSKYWKAKTFDVLPHVPMRRFAVSENMVRMFAEDFDQHVDLLPIFIHDAYHKASFVVSDHDPIRIVSSAADFSVPEKGLDILLEAMQKVTDRSLSLTLVASKGVDRDYSSYAFPVTTVFCSTPQDMICELEKHDVYINTSIKEAFGLAQAEAVALGMPVIALDAVGNRDFLDGENAIFVRDKEQLPEAIRAMCDVENRARYAARARRSMERYTITNTVDVLEMLLLGLPSNKLKNIVKDKVE